MRPLDAEDKAKCQHRVVPGDVEGLDCDPQDKDISLAACRAASRVAGVKNPPGGRQDLTTDCASDPSEREAPCDKRKKNVLFMSQRRPQLQGNLA